MSWTWAGFWMDDPVFRYKQGDFFQSGRHKAEERFWRNYIHDNGGYKSPTYWRYRQTPVSKEEPQEEKEVIIEEKKNEQTESIDEVDMNKIKELEEKKKEVEKLWNDLKVKGWKRKEQARNLKPNDLWERDEDSVSNYVCSVCSTHGDDIQKRV